MCDGYTDIFHYIKIIKLVLLIITLPQFALSFCLLFFSLTFHVGVGYGGGGGGGRG